MTHLSPELAAERQSIHDRHVQIRDHDVGDGASRHIQRADPVVRCEHLRAGGVQETRVYLPDVRSVVDDETREGRCSLLNTVKVCRMVQLGPLVFL
jgi:hypothetical protein